MKTAKPKNYDQLQSDRSHDTSTTDIESKGDFNNAFKKDESPTEGDSGIILKVKLVSGEQREHNLTSYQLENWTINDIKQEVNI